MFGFLNRRPAWAEYRIQLLGSWASKPEVFESVRRQSEDGHGRWQNLQFCSEERDIDFYVAINSPRLHGGEMQRHDPPRTLIWNVEHKDAVWRKRYGYDEFYGSSEYLKTIRLEDRLNWGQFHIAASYSDLIGTHFTKDLDFSAIISSQVDLPMHRRRVEFLKFLETKDLSFSNNGLHHYARRNDQGFKYYKGPLPDSGKDDGLRRYRYHLAVEANAEDNYVTEKLFDAVLYECLVFYCGSPNVLDWIDPRAVVVIDLNDFESAFQKIKKTIESGEYERRLQFIRREKVKILNRYNVFPAVKEILGL